MKNILITGTNSYIGNSLRSWLAKDSENYSTETISLRDEEWRTKDFSEYDVVFHVAGIAHVSSNPDMEEKYYEVNRDLTIETAKKAKNDGVKQFIFMSSIIVYGDSSSDKRVIDRNTKPNPSNFYGDSKLQAEEGIKRLGSEDFHIVIVRPPMIYGKGSKGNYPKLAKLARNMPIFPDIDNERSMLHIDNLCEFLKVMIDYEENGLFFPQNKEYVKTTELVKLIRKVHGKMTRTTKLFNPFIRLLTRVRLVNKVFGNLMYDKNMSDYSNADYQIRNLEQSIKLTEK